MGSVQGTQPGLPARSNRPIAIKGVELRTASRARLGSGARRAVCALRIAASLGALSVAAGCGGNTTYVYGTPVVTVTSTPGPFVSYRVNLSSINLTRSDNVNVPVFLASYAPERIDFAKHYDVAELLSATGAPTGTYKSATLNLDYSGASIAVDVNGKTTVASVVDAGGASLGSVSVTLTFDPAHQLVITQNQSARVALHVDLAAMNSVDTSGTTPKVTVRPFPVLSPQVTDAQSIRVRGQLVTTEPSGSDYVINARPFEDINNNAFGAVKVLVTPQTYFNVNGAVSTGTAGLTALNGLTPNSAITAVGTLTSLAGITPTFTATQVYGGESIESNAIDHIRGVVTARSGNTLTLHAANTLLRSSSSANAYAEGIVDSATLTVGSATVVNQDGGSASAPTLASISVGQEIDAAGAATLDSKGVVTALDTTVTYGQVRLRPTDAWGTLSSASAGAATLNLLGLGNNALPPAEFNFTGTGSNPAAYAVNTGSLNLSGLVANPPALVRATGFVAPLGAAPPDFNALAAVDANTLPQQLVVEWSAGTQAPFLSVGTAALVPNVATASTHIVQSGPVATTITTNPQLAFAGSGLELAIATTLAKASSSGATALFHEAASFVTQVNTTVNGTNLVHKVVALGHYDAGTNTFTATRVSILLH